MPWVAGTLLATTVVSSLFGARSARSAARAQSLLASAQGELTRTQATVSGQMERFQLRRRAEEEEAARRGYLAEAIGSQRASMAGAGIVGGRTANLIEARSQALFTRDQAYADFQTRMGLAGSRHQEGMAIAGSHLGQAGASVQASSQQAQSQANLWGGIISSGFRAYNLWQDAEAARA